MKNLKIKLKILMSFGIVIALTLIFSAFVVISSVLTINNVRGMSAELNMQSLSSDIMENFSLARTGFSVISQTFDDDQYNAIVGNISKCNDIVGSMNQTISENPSLAHFSANVSEVAAAIGEWDRYVGETQALNKELETIIADARSNQLALTRQSMGIFDYQMELSTDEASQVIAEEARLRRVSRIKTGMDIANKLNYIGNSFEVMFKSLDTSRVEEDKKVLSDTIEVLEAFLAESTLQYNIDTATSMLEALKTYEGDIDSFIDCLAKRADCISAGTAKGEDALAAVNNLLKGVEASSQDYAGQTINSAYWSLIIVVAFSLAILVLSILLALYISGVISKPVTFLRDYFKQMGTDGDMSMSPEKKAVFEKVSESRDEIGECVSACGVFVDHLWALEHSLVRVADGDLTADVKNLSDKDSMGLAINKMVGNLNSMFGELRMSSEQVSSGADQVSQSAQELASGSSEQAGSIEELSSTIADMKDQVESNAQRSQKSLENCGTAENMMQMSMDSMDRMMEAMASINESSRNITRVIKVIDDIAFQTNILALNAAVEAARAGQHGKGFAVVADEVRNLASKSASAAKETADLIEGSSQRVEEGSSIVEQTNESLKAVGVTTAENAALIGEITQSLEKQRASINEINRGMEQISSVVQANASTSEQSAAAAEEMSAQSIVMNEIVARFKLKQSGGSGSYSPKPAATGMRTDVSGFAVSSEKY